jgi:hypothetical protein
MGTTHNPGGTMAEESNNEEAVIEAAEGLLPRVAAWQM